MAGDLIPPPSPAGKPDPHAPERDARAREQDPPVLPADLEAPAPAAEPAAGPSRYRSRFGFVTGALVGVALAAIVVTGLVVAGSGGKGSSGLAWSDWHPTSGDRLVQAAEIADHVGREYRLNDGSQLVDVEAGPLSINDVPLTPVVRTAPKGGDIVPIYGTGVLYVLNGLGMNGSISKEAPSAARLALVKREAVELALYTFRYVKGIDHVVTMLPPPPPSSTTSATDAATTKDSASSATSAANVASADTSKPITTMLFRPGDLRAQLTAPLSLTFPTEPPRPATMSDRETQLLTQFTQNNTFDASVVPNQTGQGYLVLDRQNVTTDVEKTLQSTIPKSGSGK